MKKEQKILFCFLFLLIMSLPFDGWTQDSTNKTKVLIIEKVYSRVTYKHPAQYKVKIGNKIAVRRFSEDSVTKGRLDILNDSTIALNNKPVPLKDIKKINLRTGTGFIIVGIPMFLAGSVLLLSTDAVSLIYDSDPDAAGNVALISIGCLGGGVAAIFGLVLSAGRNIGKDWKIFITTVKKKK